MIDDKHLLKEEDRRLPGKDYYEKKFEDYNDVFCDIVNTLLFRGKPVVLEHELENEMSRSAYEIDGLFSEQEQDVKKTWRKRNIRIATFNMENQTRPDADMVIRNFCYEAADYKKQYVQRQEIRRVNRKRKKISSKGDIPILLSVPGYHPVITIVLLISDRRWTGSRTLKDMVITPPELKEYIPDYGIHVFEIAYLTEDQISLLKSDFRFVAEYFVLNRLEKEGYDVEYKLPLKEIKHVTAFQNLMNALTGKKDFRNIQRIIDEGEGDETMETIIDRREKRGEKRGENKMADLIAKMYTVGRGDEIRRVAVDKEYRKKLLREFDIR